MYNQNPVQPSYQYDNNTTVYTPTPSPFSFDADKYGITTIGLNNIITIAEPTA